MIEFLLGLTASTAAAVFGYTRSRRFVGDRLRYVDAVNHPATPFLAGAAATAVAIPVVALLPIVGAGTALVFGVSVGMGVASGRGEIRRSLPPA
ncbi:MAG TPA: hypothetical protein VF178_03740 [Gemmatimonadaceae bacterium]